MNEELNELIVHLRKMESNLEELQHAVSTMNSQQLSDCSQKISEELSHYRQQIEKQMTYSRSARAREMAKSQMLYFQSMDIILKDNHPPEQEETSLLYSEFTLGFMRQTVLHTLYYLINTNPKVKEKFNA